VAKPARQARGGEGAWQSSAERLIQGWCIETGIRRRTYPIDQGITLTLIEQSIDAAWIPRGASDLPTTQLVTVLGDQL